jgi:hypothetical protein
VRETIGGSYAEILSRIQNARSMMVDRTKDFTDASNSVEVLENKIEEAKEAINTDIFTENLELVKSSMKERDFTEANLISKKTLTDINSSLESWQPNIKLKLPDNIVPGKWTKSKLKITNEGNAHALSLSINFT